MKDKLFSLILFTILLLSGFIGINLGFLLVINFLLTLLLLFIIKTGADFKLPKDFKYIVLTLMFVFTSLFWSVNIIESLKFILILLPGILIYLISYLLPLSNKISTNFRSGIKLLGMVFATLFIYQFLSHKLLYATNSTLTGYTSNYRNHHNIGLLWATILIFTIKELAERTQNDFKYINKGIFIITGLFFLIISKSRSAVLSLIFCLLYIFYVSRGLGAKKYLSYLPIAGLTVIFIFLGSEKSLIFSRPYFLESLLGLIKLPWGAGMGNFGYISKNFAASQPLWEYSSLTHNFLLEFLSGIGFFGLIFAVWFFKKIIEILKSKNTDYFSITALLLSISFMFDFSYYFPIFLWMFFAALGLYEGKIKLTTH